MVAVEFKMPTSMKTYFSILAFWLTLLFPLSAQSSKIDPQQKQQPHKIYWSQVRHQDGRKITVNRVAPPEPVQIAPTENLPENEALHTLRMIESCLKRA